MGRDLRLHREHGVNPTCAVCFWCGRNNGELVLLGASYQGQAPTRMVLNSQPCGTCKAKMDSGVTIVEASDVHAKGRLEIAPNIYATGRWVVIDAAHVPQLVIGQVLIDQVLKHRKTFMDIEAFEMKFGEIMKKVDDERGDQKPSV